MRQTRAAYSSQGDSFSDLLDREVGVLVGVLHEGHEHVLVVPRARADLHTRITSNGRN